MLVINYLFNKELVRISHNFHEPPLFQAKFSIEILITNFL